MIIESLSKAQRKKLKRQVKLINDFIELRTINIKGYYEPKNVEIEFNQGNLPDSVKVIKAVKELLPKFNLWCFDNK